MKKLFLVALCLMLAACSSTTIVRSADKEAKIYINGEFLGSGSVTYTDTKIVGSTNLVTLKKEGCEDRNYTFSRDEVFDAGACLGGVFVLFPFLWVMKYKPTHSYDFVCTK